jgi:hypothetical protein
MSDGINSAGPITRRTRDADRRGQGIALAAFLNRVARAVKDALLDALRRAAQQAECSLHHVGVVGSESRFEGLGEEVVLT